MAYNTLRRKVKILTFHKIADGLEHISVLDKSKAFLYLAIDPPAILSFYITNKGYTLLHGPKLMVHYLNSIIRYAGEYLFLFVPSQPASEPS